MMEEKILIAGFGGQGVMMIGQLLAYCGSKYDYNSLWFPSYGPETRGGTANCSIIIAKNPIYSPVFQQANTVIIMNQPSLERFQSRVINGGCLLYNASLIDPFPLQDGIQGLGVPINQLANELGNLKVANVVMLGAYLEMSRLFTLDEMTSVLIDFLQDGKEKYIDINSQALIKGWNYAKEYKRVKKSI